MGGHLILGTHLHEKFLIFHCHFRRVAWVQDASVTTKHGRGVVAAVQRVRAAPVHDAVQR